MPQSRQHVPVSEEISAAMKIAETSAEAAEYVVERVTKILTETKMVDKSGDLLSKLRDFAKYIDFKLRSGAQIWSGQAAKPTDFKNMQEHIATDALKAVKEHAKGTINFDIAISAAAQILRAFSVNGEQIKDQAILESLDKLFNAWLADNNIVSHDSTLYEANEKGEIKNDANGEVHANPVQIKKLMEDPDKGFAKYAEEKNLALNLDAGHTYPADQGSQKQAQSGTTGEALDADAEGPKM